MPSKYRALNDATRLAHADLTGASPNPEDCFAMEPPSGVQLRPTLHEEYFVGDRVLIKGFGEGLDGCRGRIVGIGMAHIVFQYIVKLEEPIEPPGNFEGEPWECILVPGGCLGRIRGTRGVRA